MSYTGIHYDVAGATFYAKPSEAQTPWADDIIVGVASSVYSQEYAFAGLDEGQGYVVIKQAGGSPAASDVAVGSFSATANTGTGARTVTITVQADSSPVEGATVRLTSGGVNVSNTTNASGVAVFAVDDATYSVAASKSGYSGTTATLVVDGDEAETYTITALASGSPTTPGTLIGQLVTLNQYGAAESGVEVSVQISEGPGDAGIAYDSATWTVTSDVNGLCEFDGMVANGRYKVWRGDEVKHNVFTVPATAVSDRFDIDEFIGKD